MVIAPYPSTGSERTRWILERRGPGNAVDPQKPYAYFVEQERTASGSIVEVATVFLTNRECPWKCAMCDLWRNTTVESVPFGAILNQVAYALERLGSARILKLYNSGSFFDEAAISRNAWQGIADACRNFEHLIVECHPRLINRNVVEFAGILPCTLEVALGLETAHPASLEALNKRSSTDDYSRACGFLKRNGIAVRTFLLVHPPFIPTEEQGIWLQRSVQFAFECGSDVVSLIPLRSGNGAIEQLISLGLAAEPSLNELEEAHALGIRLGMGRIFMDTWDIGRFGACRDCSEERASRIARMNHSQCVEPRLHCRSCGNS